MEGTLEVGLVGCGNWGRHILRDLSALGCRTTVVARSPESHARAGDGGAAAVVKSVADLPVVSGVVVATPSATHAGLIEALLGRNVPVFVEKPFINDAEVAARLAAAAPERLFVMDKWRYHAGVEALRDIARSGELGPPAGLRTTRVQWTSSHADTDVAWHLAPHDLAIALEVLGAIPEPRAAHAHVVDGEAVGIMGLLGGDPWHVLEISHGHLEHRREVRLVCRDGSAVLRDAYADHIEVARAGSPQPEPEPERRPISREMPLLLELRAFVEHLQGGPPPRSSAAEGLANVRAVAELRRLAGLGA